MIDATTANYSAYCTANVFLHFLDGEIAFLRWSHQVTDQIGRNLLAKLQQGCPNVLHRDDKIATWCCHWTLHISTKFVTDTWSTPSTGADVNWLVASDVEMFFLSQRTREDKSHPSNMADNGPKDLD
ncbi:uncharacterized protein LOC144208756 [Stigmatopora nigra]